MSLSRKYYFPFLFFFFINSFVFSQNQELDSLMNLLETVPAREIGYVLAEISLKCAPEKKLSYIKKAQAFARQYNNRKALALVYYSNALFLSNEFRLDEADSVAKKCLKISKEINDSLSISRAYFVLGYVRYSKDLYSEAIPFFRKGLKYTPKHNIYQQHLIQQKIAKSFFNIGDYDKAYRITYELEKYHETRNDNKHADAIANFLGAIAENMNDIELAKKYYRKAFFIGKEKNDTFRCAQVCLGLGNTFLQKENNPDSATYYLQEGLRYAKKGNKKDLEAQICLALGETAYMKKNYREALTWYQKSLQISQATQSYWKSFYAYLAFAKTYNSLGTPQESLKYLKKSRSLLDRMDNQLLKIDYYDALATTFAKIGDFEKAYIARTKYSVLNADYLTNKFNQNLANLRIQKEIDQKEKENEYLIAENHYKENEIKNQQHTILIGIIFFIISLTYLIIFFIRKKKMQKINRLLEERNGNLLEVNEKLKKLDKYKEGLTKMIIHDLKNPLNVVLTLTDKELVKESANIMFNLISNLLDISKLEESKMILHLKIIWLGTTADLAIKKVILSANLADIRIVNNIEKIITVYADGDLTERIFINLLTNAIKYSPKGGKVIIDAKEIPSGYAHITVQDFGKGIPPDKTESIFEMFTQIKAKDTETFRSSGIGLSFCKLAVEAMGGRIGVKSTLGKGSIFWFELPLHPMDIFDDLQSKKEIIVDQQNND